MPSAVARAVRIHISGVVQGVGFRPFVYAHAARCGVAGWVCNDADGVRVHAEGEAAAVDAFVEVLRTSAPPAAATAPPQ